MPVVLVTGATGGVGQEVVRELLAATPPVTVRCLVRAASEAKARELWPIAGSTGDAAGPGAARSF